MPLSFANSFCQNPKRQTVILADKRKIPIWDNHFHANTHRWTARRYAPATWNYTNCPTSPIIERNWMT
jgi:hypothetical protein